MKEMGFATAVVPVRLGCEAVVAGWNLCTQNKSGEREEKSVTIASACIDRLLTV